MLALYGAKCQTCGWAKINPSTDKVPVQLHHIDGDDTNNVLENVELLCPNCHSLTPNFMALNMSLENRAKAKNYFKKLAREEEVESPPRDLEAL
jgi:5-methylcytosine-specific restriction endonuclease McrA